MQSSRNVCASTYDCFTDTQGVSGKFYHDNAAKMVKKNAKNSNK